MFKNQGRHQGGDPHGQLPYCSSKWRGGRGGNCPPQNCPTEFSNSIFCPHCQTARNDVSYTFLSEFYNCPPTFQIAPRANFPCPSCADCTPPLKKELVTPLLRIACAVKYVFEKYDEQNIRYICPIYQLKIFQLWI